MHAGEHAISTGNPPCAAILQFDQPKPKPYLSQYLSHSRLRNSLHLQTPLYHLTPRFHRFLIPSQQSYFTLWSKVPDRLPFCAHCVLLQPLKPSQPRAITISPWQPSSHQFLSRGEIRIFPVSTRGKRVVGRTHNSAKNSNRENTPPLTDNPSDSHHDPAKLIPTCSDTTSTGCTHFEHLLKQQSQMYQPAERDAVEEALHQFWRRKGIKLEAHREYVVQECLRAWQGICDPLSSNQLPVFLSELESQVKVFRKLLPGARLSRILPAKPEVLQADRVLAARHLVGLRALLPGLDLSRLVEKHPSLLLREDALPVAVQALSRLQIQLPSADVIRMVSPSPRHMFCLG
mmetsp:Transcript_33753/g.63568  ORF Transcript_33753/g.63568 Transcript_33753/m.63568 type:complete len:346 (+) Transcript_33753:407-1444(+)